MCMLEFGGGFIIFNRMVSARKLPAEVIWDLYPFTEYPEWEPKWYLQLRAEIRSQKVDLGDTPGNFLISCSAALSHYSLLVYWRSVPLEQGTVMHK